MFTGFARPDIDHRKCASKLMYVEAVIRQVPGFSAERHRAILQDIQSEIDRVGYWELEAHRLFIIASKPGK